MMIGLQHLEIRHLRILLNDPGKIPVVVTQIAGQKRRFSIGLGDHSQTEPVGVIRLLTLIGRVVVYNLKLKIPQRQTAVLVIDILHHLNSHLRSRFQRLIVYILVIPEMDIRLRRVNIAVVIRHQIQRLGLKFPDHRISSPDMVAVGMRSDIK